LRLNHHRGKLSVLAVYRGLQDDHAPPHMDGRSNPGKPPWHAGAKDIRFGFDRGCPKPRWDVEPRQSSTEIIGERRQCTAMHMAAVVEMTIIDSEFADELILVGVGNPDAEVSGHTGSGRGGGHLRAPFADEKIADYVKLSLSYLVRAAKLATRGAECRFPLRVRIAVHENTALDNPAIHALLLPEQKPMMQGGANDKRSVA
jgi:hypothetical protein